MSVKFLKPMLFVSGLLGCTMAANAQSEVVKVHVPFAFVVGGTPLPAGDYRVDSGEAPNVLVIQGAGNSAAFLSVLAGPLTPSKGPALVFETRGGDRVLSAVRFGDDQMHILSMAKPRPQHAALKSATLASPVLH